MSGDRQSTWRDGHLTVGSKLFHRLGGPQVSEREQGGRGGREPKQVVIGLSHNRSDRSRYSLHSGAGDGLTLGVLNSKPRREP